MKKTRSYYLDNGEYFDITTGNTYTPRTFCEICGLNSGWVNLEVHHFLPQQKCERDKKSKIKAPYIWTQDFINENQKLYTVCQECHRKIHNCTSKKTIINGRRIYDYLWRKEKTEVVTRPNIIIVKKNR